MIRAKMPPDRIECLQPSKQRRILCRRHNPGQILKQVVMRIHHAGNDNMPAKVNDRVSMAWQFPAFADFFDNAITRKNTAIGNFRAGDRMRCCRIHRA